MISIDQIPDEAWVALALRLESCGFHNVSEMVVRLAAVDLLNAWTGAEIEIVGESDNFLIPPLPQKDSQ